ncbi:MAG: SDR family oxidoreductase [Acidimicrobiales bacterium]
MTEIAGRVAFVTGGGSGIGQGVAIALAAEGASVAVADIHEERARSVAAEIAAAGGSAVGVVCDVSDRRSISEARSQVLDAYGPVSLLFANAGVTSLQPLVEMSTDDVDWIMSVNLLGVLYCLEAFLPDLIGQGSGHVVATSSMAGLITESLAQHGPYAAAKLGVLGLMLNLRLELSELGVGSTVLCPGGVTTRI